MPLSETALAISFEEFLQELPNDYHDLAIEFKAFARARKIARPADLLQLVMLYCGVDSVLREVAGEYTLLQERISDTAVEKRLKACLPWLKALVKGMLPTVDGLIQGRRLVIVDGSTISAPGAKGTSWRLHLAIDLLSLSFSYVEVTDAQVGESLLHFPFQAGDLVIVDRGYNHPHVILEYAARGVAVVLRLNPYAMPLWTPASEDRIDLYEQLKHYDGAGFCMPVELRKNGQRCLAWVHGRRLPADKIARARQKCRERARKKTGSEPKASTLLFAEWLLVFTTIPPESLNTDGITMLYRLRWQVELFIKRLKSLLHLDRLRNREGSLLGEVWLYGKLLFAMAVEKRVWRLYGPPGFGDETRNITPWRLWKIVHASLSACIREVHRWRWGNAKQALAVVQERPRRRRLQTASAVLRRFMLNTLQEGGLARIPETKH